MTEQSLAQFISTTREQAGYSQTGLAMRANLPLSVIESIESGQELFLSTSIRQKLAKGLKLEPKDIKPYEKSVQDNGVKANYIENIKQMILSNETQSLNCPVCKSKLDCRIEEMYDLDNILVKHPKARCSKCPFQIK